MLTEFSGLKCWVDLGPHTPHALTSWLHHLDATTRSPEEKLACLARKFIGTPFQFESRMAQIPHDAMRLCLSAFDCVTLIYHVLALALAHSFDEYVRRLFEIRYDHCSTPRISNERETGTLFDFACEALLENAVERGFLKDVTAAAAPASLLNIRVTLQPVARPPDHDAEQCVVYPRRGARTITAAAIPTQHLEKVARGAIRTGDLVLFTLGAFNADGSPRQLFIRHVAVAIEGPEGLNLLRATKDYFWRPGNTDLRDRKASGLFLEDDPEKELIGVGIAGEYVGDEHTTQVGGVKFFGYDQTRPRALSNYAAGNFVGAKVLRVCRPAA